MKASFWGINKFKAIFSVLFIAVTAVLFLLGDNFPNLNTPALNIAFAVLYFPAGLFVFYFSQLPVFKTCSLSFGEQICSYNQTVAVWLSIPIFLIYVYLLACVIDKFLHRIA